jgi:DNA-binding SARP family transcriptional activator
VPASARVSRNDSRGLVRTPGLVRPRLLEELAELETSRLALVIAPAGAGKTTLLAQYAAAWPGRVAWWSAEPTDTSAASVVRGLGAALLGWSGPDPGTEVDRLLAALRVADPADTLLVVDDLHYLCGAEPEAALEAVVARAPGWLHVLAGGRRMPGFNLCRYELADVGILDAEQLRFRSWEAELLLRDVYREPLPPDDVAALARRVGGWAAGLHMFHLSTRGRPLAERRRAVAALDGRSALSRTYLTRTVIAELPADLREFLVRTCVFEVLTARRCEQLLGEPGTCQQYLAELERRQAFTSSADGGLTYRYHEVLRAYLALTLAEEVGDAAAREWHARAGALLAAEGADVEAARAYARAEDWAAVRRLLDATGANLADTDPWQDLLPDWLIAEDPWLTLAKGRHLLGRGQLAAAVDCLRVAEAQFSDERGRSRCRSMRRIASTWLPGSTGPSDHYGAGLREATRHHPALVASAWDGQPLVRAVAYLLAGNLAEASRLLTAEVPADASLVSLALRLVGAGLELVAGSPSGRRLLIAVIADAERAGPPWLVRVARAAGALDGGEPGAAEARAVVAECDRDGDPWGAALARAALCLARSTAVPVAPDEVDDALDLVRRCAQLDAGVLAAWAQALLAIAAARNGLAEAELEAHRAESLARAAGVPGARAAGLAAAARGGAGAVDLPALAAESGLPLALLTRWSGRDDRAPSRPVPAGPGPASAAQPTVEARPAPAPPVEVRCFGGFSMRLHGRLVDWSAVKPRTRTAVRLLAMHAGRPVHRETMIEALWPGTPAASATRNLHVALSSLRTFLEPGNPRGRCDLVVRDGDAYELALPGGGYSDVAAFHSALDTGRRARLDGDLAAQAEALRTAVLTYDGELLPEDGPAEWVVREREALRRRAVEAAVDLATIALGTGEIAEAVGAAERCVRIDPYYDPGWRLLIDGYDAQGNPAAAERARRGYAEMLSALDVAATTGEAGPAGRGSAADRIGVAGRIGAR